MKWTDIDEIAIQLWEKHPEVNPISIRFTDLHRWVTELPGFDDNPKNSNEKILEAIQMRWLDEYE